MKSAIRKLDASEMQDLISSEIAPKLNEVDARKFEAVRRVTQMAWAGYIGKKFVCVYGLIPPTLLSDNAWLWLHTTDEIKGNEFIFVRQSQRAVEAMLKVYPALIGNCEVGAEHSIRWVKWLGGKFGEPVDGLTPFVIRRA